MAINPDDELVAEMRRRHEAHKGLVEELVEAPFGMAEEILKKRGLWDEKRAEPTPGIRKKYRVRVTGSMEVFTTVTVEAESDDEAIELAEDLASERSFKWVDHGDFDVEYAEIESRTA